MHWRHRVNKIHRFLTLMEWTLQCSGDDSTEKSDHEISLDSETVPIIFKGWSHINNINVTKELVRYTNSQVHTRLTESETLGDWAEGFVF